MTEQLINRDRPTLRDLLIHVIPSVAITWYELGLVLLDPKYQNALKSVEADTRNDSVTTSCRKMFSKWLDTDELASWDKLIKALRIVQLNDVANDIEQLLLQGSTMDTRGSVTNSNLPGSSYTVGYAVDWLSGHMKGRYRSMRLKKYKDEKDPWPPIKTKSYVTLAIVHQKELQTRQETTATIYLRTKGDIHKIPHTIGTDKLTDITQIFDPVSGRVSNSILIEGHAGIGKTTFVKEICIEWAEGKLLTSDKLVLLLLLRDPNVQKITNERILIEHFTKHSTGELHKELVKSHGAGVTLIIDGFDELNTTLRQESFFRKLIEKRCLSEAKIVVTSRPSASACLHDVVDRRLEILGFEQSSRNQYVTEALQDSPSKLEKLQRHFQQYPNIDAICYIPLIMSIIVFLCMCQPDDLPPTATKMYASFILHTICHYLKRVGKIPEDKVINKLEQFPPVVYKALQQIEKTAFDGLVRDKIVFTVEELPVLCNDDPTCYGLLQCTECYSAEEIGTPTQSFNFLHLGIQEYFAAKYVTKLTGVKVHKLLKESFIVTKKRSNPDPDSESIRLSNMWILYCGITSGQCKTLRHYLTTYCKPNDARMSLHSNLHNQQIGTRIISQDVLEDPVKVLYLFQCFQEAQDNELCEVLSKSFDSGEINISVRLLPHQVVSLGFFLSRSHRKWKKLNLSWCYIGDHGMRIIHHYLCGDKIKKQEISEINLDKNNLTGASSHLIADIISHLQPHTLALHYNNITNMRDISTAVINTSTVKVLDIGSNHFTTQETVIISDMMICLEELNISNIELGDHGAELLSEGIASTQALRELEIYCNNIGPSGTTAIANALKINTSLQLLNINQNNIGPSGATAIANALTINTSLQQLSICYNNIGPSGATAIANALTINTSLQQLDISNNNIGPSGATAIANASTINISLQELDMFGNEVGQDGAIAIAKAITNNKTLKTLSLSNDTMDKESVMIIMRSLHCNNTITKLRLPSRLSYDDSIKGEVIKINDRRNKCNEQELGVTWIL